MVADTGLTLRKRVRKRAVPANPANLVKPIPLRGPVSFGEPGRQCELFGREAGRNEAGRKSTRTGKHDVGINRQRWPQLWKYRRYGPMSEMGSTARFNRCSLALPLCPNQRTFNKHGRVVPQAAINRAT